MFKNTATRRGTAIAAAALSLAMVAPSVTPAYAADETKPSETATVTPINLAPKTAEELAAVLKGLVIEAYPGETAEANLKDLQLAQGVAIKGGVADKGVTYENGVLKIAVPADAKVDSTIKFTLTIEGGDKAEQADVTVKVIEKSAPKTLAPSATTLAETTVTAGKADSIQVKPRTATFSNLKATASEKAPVNVEVKDNKVNYTVSKDAKEGDKFDIVVTYTLTFPGGTTQEVTATFPFVVGKAQSNETPKPPANNADASSKLTESCKQILPLAGIPLLALIPAGLLSQIALGSSANVTNVINQQIRDFNAEIQRQAGILNPELAAAIESADKFLQAYGYSVASATVGLAALAGGIAASAVILERCLPGTTGGASLEGEVEVSKETKKVLDELKGSSQKLKGSSVKVEATPTPTAENK